MINERLTAEENRALMELKDVLKGLLGDRLQVLVLYGSKARGDWDSKSDIDVAIVVKGLTGKGKKNCLGHRERRYTLVREDNKRRNILLKRYKRQIRH